MILADSSVWIDFFRGAATPRTDELAFRLKRDEVVMGDLILAELLQGFRTDRQADAALDTLGSLPVVVIADAGIAILAARNYRHLRALGITVRKTIDTLIATRCILDALPLLYSDRDFDPLVQHLGLRPALA